MGLPGGALYALCHTKVMQRMNIGRGESQLKINQKLNAKGSDIQFI